MPALTANELELIIKATDNASGVLRRVSKEVESTGKASAKGADDSNRLGGAWDFINTKGSALIGNIVKVGAVAGAAIGTAAAAGLGSMATYAFNATRETQGYVAGIKALSVNSAEAGDVIKSMVDYVQGKPFDRIEVLGAARNLMVFGRSAAQTKSDIELLGRASILSGKDIDSLSQVYGRVMSSGRLMNDDFNQLMYAGVNVGKTLTQNLGVDMDTLRKKMANGEVSAEEFRKALDQAVPADAVASASNTIDNKIKSLSGSFRNLGFELLGVDFSKVDSSGQPLVQPGGLLDRMSTMADRVTTWLKDPSVKQGFETIGNMAGDGAGKLLDFFTWLDRSGKVVAEIVKPNIDQLVKTYNEDFAPSLEKMRPVLEVFGQILGVVIVASIMFLINAITMGMQVLSGLFNWINSTGKAIGDFAWGAAQFIGQVIDTFNKLKDAAQKGWDFISKMDWGKALGGAAKGIGNGLIGMIEGTINNAIGGLPGKPQIRIPRFATGTNFAPGGYAWVGENGPELINVPRGSQVKTAAQSRELAGRQGSTVTIGEVHVHNEADEDRLIRSISLRFALG